MRVAAIDLGTNSTRLLVADVEHGRLRDVDRDTTITRLGEGVDGRRRLLPVPITRVRNVLVDYRRRLEALEAERTLAIATSAVRDAENGEAFLGEVEWGYGFSTALLSGGDEALMMFRGVTAERDLSDRDRDRRHRRRVDRARRRGTGRSQLAHEPRHRLRTADRARASLGPSIGRRTGRLRGCGAHAPQRACPGRRAERRHFGDRRGWDDHEPRGARYWNAGVRP